VGTRFRRDYGPVLRQTTRWINQWMTGHKNVISSNYLKLVKACIADWRMSHAHLYHQVPHVRYNFLVPALYIFTTSPRPIIYTNDSLVLLFFRSSGFSFQAQFLPTSFFFMAMCCMFDSFAVLFDRVDNWLLQIILEKKWCLYSMGNTASCLWQESMPPAVRNCWYLFQNLYWTIATHFRYRVVYFRRC
jgi:hypothetical protein